MSTLISTVTCSNGSITLHASGSTFHSSWLRGSAGELITTRVEFTASLDSRIRLSMCKVKFNLITHSCLSLSLGMPICHWVDSSFSVAFELLRKNSTIAFSLSTLGFITFKTSLTNRVIVCARHGWWVHFRT